MSAVNSLQARLVLAIVLVAAAALIAAGTISTQSTRLEYSRIELARRVPPPPIVQAQRVQNWYARRGSWSGVSSVLQAQGNLLLLFSPSGTLLGASVPNVRKAVLLGRSPQSVVHLRIARPLHESEDLYLQGLPEAAVRDRRGAQIASLYMVLPPKEARIPAASRLIGQLWLAIGIGLLIAIVAAAVISRSILAPVRALAAATAALKSGDLTKRVQVGGPAELSELVHRFNELAAHLEESEELRKRMIADVAHELRTPLTNIRGLTEAIQDGHIPAGAASLQSLDEETRSLERLIDDLQDLSLADSRQLAFAMRAVSINGCVLSVCDAVAPGLRTRGVDLVFEPAADDPVVHADPVRLRQVIANLLGNAAHFAPEGTLITVTAASGDSAVRVSVCDAGPGVPQAERERIFERFYRLDESRSRKSGGAGLGLSIAKAIVKAHGGAIGVQNNAGPGATFWFELPAYVSPQRG